MKTNQQELVDQLDQTRRDMSALKAKAAEVSEAAKEVQRRLDAALEECNSLRMGFTRQQARAEAFEEIVDRMLGKKHQPAKDDTTFTASHRRNSWE